MKLNIRKKNFYCEAFNKGVILFLVNVFLWMKKLKNQKLILGHIFATFKNRKDVHSIIYTWVSVFCMTINRIFISETILWTPITQDGSNI